MGRMGASLAGTELLLLNRLGRKQAAAFDGLEISSPPEENSLLEQNQALAGNALAALSILGDQRQQMADVICQIADR